MTTETPRQFNIFTGELVDTRTDTQKKRDRKTEAPQPLEMFAQRDLAQFGVTGRPIMPLTVNTALGLEREDHRTDEEKERDLQHEAEALTAPLLNACTALILYVPPDTRLTIYEPAPGVQSLSAQPDHQEEPPIDEDWLLFFRATTANFAFSVL